MVIIVKIEDEEGNKEIMKNKNKLKGDRLFIENGLSFEERKIQEKISKWAKDKRSRGTEVRVGRGRVRIRRN